MKKYDKSFLLLVAVLSIGFSLATYISQPDFFLQSKQFVMYGSLVIAFVGLMLDIKVVNKEHYSA